MKYCCETLKQQVEYTCPQHGDDCPDKVLEYNKDDNKFTLIARNAFYICRFCPWCGQDLKTLRSSTG